MTPSRDHGAADPNSLRACDRCGAWADPDHTAEECEAIRIVAAARAAASVDDAFNSRINDAILLVDRVKRGGAITSADVLRLEATVGEMASAIRQRWFALAPCDAFAAPAHSPGARVVPTGGER